MVQKQLVSVLKIWLKSMATWRMVSLMIPFGCNRLSTVNLIAYCGDKINQGCAHPVIANSLTIAHWNVFTGIASSEYTQVCCENNSHRRTKISFSSRKPMELSWTHWAKNRIIIFDQYESSHATLMNVKKWVKVSKQSQKGLSKPTPCK